VRARRAVEIPRAVPIFSGATQTMSATMYFLSKDCFVCRMGCYWIILSANRDRYLCVAHAELASIGDQLYGWSQLDGSMARPSPIGAETRKLVESLTTNGILTSNRAIGKPFAESEYPAPENRIKAFESTMSARVPLFSILRFFLACAKADWQLRTKALSRTLTRIERRRLRADSSSVIGNVPHVSTLIAAFQALRPLYPRSYLCLFDSLALLEFLAGYRFHPRVVFGVVADPFQAHCWLQDGSTVINDELERVGRYKPILSV
jgi:Transglutaminase-like superfamily